MVKEYAKFMDGIIRASQQIQKNWPQSPIKTEMDYRNELQCLKLYEEGWKQDGFDFVPNSHDIITHWKKDDEYGRKQVLLTFMQQRRWIRELEKRKKRGNLK